MIDWQVARAWGLVLLYLIAAWALLIFAAIGAYRLAGG